MPETGKAWKLSEVQYVSSFGENMLQGMKLWVDMYVCVCRSSTDSGSILERLVQQLSSVSSPEEVRGRSASIFNVIALSCQRIGRVSRCCHLHTHINTLDTKNHLDVHLLKW